MIGQRLTWNPEMGDAEFDGFSVCGPAIKPLNLETLWPRCVKRGDNVVIPGVDGQLERGQDQDQITVDLWLQFVGGCQQSGDWPSPIPDIRGIRRNHKVLSNLFRPSSVYLLLTDPDGDQYGGNVQTELSDIGNDGGQIMRVSVSITIPRGELLEVVGS